jgi:hypothetical protein
VIGQRESFPENSATRLVGENVGSEGRKHLYFRNKFSVQVCQVENGLNWDIKWAILVIINSFLIINDLIVY